MFVPSFLQSLDKIQGHLWVAEHRLPLFLRSDLLFEYKLCKFLTSSMASKTTHTTSGTLPTLSHSAQAIPRRHSLASLPQGVSSPHHTTTIPISRSNSTLMTDRHPRVSFQTRRHRWSVSLQPTGLPPLASDHLCNEECDVLDSKVGMSSFRRFLEGKAGERSWLFWLDAERVKHAIKPTEQQR